MTTKWIERAFTSLVLAICILSFAYVRETLRTDELQQVYIKPQTPHSVLFQLMSKRGCAIYFNILYCSPNFISRRLYNA